MISALLSSSFLLKKFCPDCRTAVAFGRFKNIFETLIHIDSECNVTVLRNTFFLRTKNYLTSTRNDKTAEWMCNVFVFFVAFSLLLAKCGNGIDAEKKKKEKKG